jgi:4a-hydroxytetrahydrobiopterin dehydratase
MERLDEDQIKSRLLEIDEGWERDGDTIKRHFKFGSFMDAIGFINRIAEYAEGADHHPEIYNVYDQVDLTLTTHDADGLTDKDFDLAARIDNALR